MPMPDAFKRAIAIEPLIRQVLERAMPMPDAFKLGGGRDETA
jgi:hypothetical protein